MSVATRDWLPSAPARAPGPRHLRVPEPRPALDDLLEPLVPADRRPVQRRQGVRHFPDTGLRARVSVPAVLLPELVAPPEALFALPAPRRRPHRVIGGLLLNLLALAGLAMMALTVWAATHDLRPLVVRSGSMEPLLATGGMVLVQDVPATALRTGDVVAVRLPDGATVTHRIVSLTRRGDLAELVLKGDANESVDPAPVTVDHAGRLVWSAPVLGRLAAWSASARGGFVLGAVIAGVSVATLRRRTAVR